jgi:hypothetical protein
MLLASPHVLHFKGILDFGEGQPCAPWRARQATSSNRLQYEGAPDRSQYE